MKNEKTKDNANVAPKKVNWFDDFYLLNGESGITALAFWTMSLFVRKIRRDEEQGSFPFLEYSGLPKSGKTETVNFLWKLFGNGDFAEQDPQRMTTGHMRRYLSGTLNAPAVLNEEGKGFNPEILEGLFYGFFPTEGATNQPECKRPPVILNQKYPVGLIAFVKNEKTKDDAEIISRTVQCVADNSPLTADQSAALKRLKSLKSESVIDFLQGWMSYGTEEQFLDEQSNYSSVYAEKLRKKGVSDNGIAKNHAQLIAVGRCLHIFFREFTDKHLEDWLAFMFKTAIDSNTAYEKLTKV